VIRAPQSASEPLGRRPYEPAGCLDRRRSGAISPLGARNEALCAGLRPSRRPPRPIALPEPAPTAPPRGGPGRPLRLAYGPRSARGRTPSVIITTNPLTDARWGQIKRPPWGQCKRPLRAPFVATPMAIDQAAAETLSVSSSGGAGCGAGVRGSLASWLDLWRVAFGVDS
jgi:hypothetical protein